MPPASERVSATSALKDGTTPTGLRRTHMPETQQDIPTGEPTPTEGARQDITGQSGQTFTQADVDRIVAERLARERAKYGDYKQLKAKAAELDQLKEAEKTAVERLQSQLSEAVARAEQAEREVWRERAARRHGLDDDLASFLDGTTEEEFEERAKTLAEKVASAKAAEDTKRRGPRPDPTRGQSADAPASPAAQFAAVFDTL